MGYDEKVSRFGTAGWKTQVRPSHTPPAIQIPDPRSDPCAHATRRHATGSRERAWATMPGDSLGARACNTGSGVAGVRGEALGRVRRAPPLGWPVQLLRARSAPRQAARPVTHAGRASSERCRSRPRTLAYAATSVRAWLKLVPSSPQASARRGGREAPPLTRRALRREPL